MPTQLTRHNFSEEFYSILNTIEGQINIISPFIGRKTAGLLSEYLISKPQVKCRIITRFYREDFIQNVSSLDGLELLLTANAEIFALQDLHTKLYLFDKSSAIMGSANFTYGGFYNNHELSVLFTEEEEIIKDFHTYFKELLTLVKSNGDWEIDLKRIEQEKDIVSRSVFGRKKGISKPNDAKWGAILNGPIRTQDNIEEYLEGTDDYIVDTGFWLKFEGTGEDRIPNNTKYYDRKISRGDPNITLFPKNPRGIKSEDIIYLAVISYDSLNKPTPVIIGRTYSKGFNPRNIISGEEIHKHPWMHRFPYYLELVKTEVIDTEIINGISLLSLYRDIGIKAFPSLYGRKDLKSEDITHLHFRRSHLHITKDAKEYLDKKLEELFTKYGVKKY